MGEDAFVIKASISYLAEKKRAYLKERFEILSRYSAVSALDLKKKISDGKAPEHPGWEDMIDIENIEAEVAEIEVILGIYKKLQRQVLQEFSDIVEDRDASKSILCDYL